MRATLREPDQVQQPVGLLAGRRARQAADQQRHRHVLGGREFAEQVMELVDEAELAIAHQAAAYLVELVEALAFDLHFSRRRLVEPA